MSHAYTVRRVAAQHTVSELVVQRAPHDPMSRHLTAALKVPEGTAYTSVGCACGDVVADVSTLGALRLHAAHVADKQYAAMPATPLVATPAPRRTRRRAS